MENKLINKLIELDELLINDNIKLDNLEIKFKNGNIKCENNLEILFFLIEKVRIDLTNKSDSVLKEIVDEKNKL